jgi:PKHD-type hydroxylase|tara:strand:+ start:116 stop:760 length:645 start_codon:yes stop_codon:yes gene_type:complete
MNISNHYWYFQSAVPPRICDMIVQYGKAEKKRETLGITGAVGRNRDLSKNPISKKEMKDNNKVRNSNIVWMNDPWIYKEIHPYVHMANKNAGWNFEWDFSESCQFTIYRKGQYYGWHRDSWDRPYDEDGPTKGKIRKLSVTVSLSDPGEYKGGELEFDFKNEEPHKKPNIRTCTEILSKGSLVVFPSFVFHRVKPVTKGVRHSLVIWNLGYPFK